MRNSRLVFGKNGFAYNGLFILGMLMPVILADAHRAAAQSGTSQMRREGNVRTAIEKGVRVVLNPRDPIFGDIKLDLEEELKVGKEDDPNELFDYVADLAVDTAGSIYVVDTYNYRIQKFAKDGKHLQTIGRKGQGPGEFQRPLKIIVDETGKRIVVVDRAKTLRVSDPAGRYVSSLPVEYIVRFFPEEGGKFMAVVMPVTPDDLTYTHLVCRLDSKGNVEKAYAEYPFNLIAYKDGSTTVGVYTNFELSVWLAKMNKSTYVYGYSGQYELNVIGADGTVLYKIRKDEPAPEFSSAEKREFGKHPVPGKKPYFFNILTDSRERIYVLRNYCHGKITYEVRKEKVDVFSREGDFLYRTELPPNTRIIRDGLLYCYEMDEDSGLEVVKRYKIKNWDQIKTGK